MGTQNLWTLKRCEYSTFVGTSLIFCGQSKFVGSKIEVFKFVGTQILWLSNMKSKKRIELVFLSKNKKISPFFSSKSDYFLQP